MHTQSLPQLENHGDWEVLKIKEELLIKHFDGLEASDCTHTEDVLKVTWIIHNIEL